MTLAERAESFKAAYPKWPAAWPYVRQEQGRDVLYGMWVIGNDYRNKTKYYGAYPNGFLQRLSALYPDQPRTLHVFSGSLGPGRYCRLDSNPDNLPDIVGNVYDVRSLVGGEFALVVADPPYTQADAKKYNTPMIVRGKVTRALAAVTKPGGYLAWLDTVWPMHRKDQWITVGRITVIRSTNHRVRLLTLFERTAD